MKPSQLLRNREFYKQIVLHGIQQRRIDPAITGYMAVNEGHMDVIDDISEIEPDVYKKTWIIASMNDNHVVMSNLEFMRREDAK